MNSRPSWQWYVSSDLKTFTKERTHEMFLHTSYEDNDIDNDNDNDIVVLIGY